MVVYTVGHSNHPIDNFLDLLSGNGITAVADVRSQPFSRRFPQFNKERLAATPLFKQGVERILTGAEKFRVALMCAEKEPLDCHRTLLVSRALEKRGASIAHILADGNIETQAQTMTRLTRITRHADIDAACRLREQK
jgi:uncharacterized protein (DUF488 family)